MFGKAAFLCKTFATVLVGAGEGGGISGVNGGHVFGEFAFLFKAFITYCARKGRGVGGVDGVGVSGEFAFFSEAFITYLAGKGRGRVCVFVQQVISHAQLGCSSSLAQAAQEGGRAG